MVHGKVNSNSHQWQYMLLSNRTRWKIYNIKLCNIF